MLPPGAAGGAARLPGRRRLSARPRRTAASRRRGTGEGEGPGRARGRRGCAFCTARLHCALNSRGGGGGGGGGGGRGGGREGGRQAEGGRRTSPAWRRGQLSSCSRSSLTSPGVYPLSPRGGTRQNPPLSAPHLLLLLLLLLPGPSSQTGSLRCSPHTGAQRPSPGHRLPSPPANPGSPAAPPHRALPQRHPVPLPRPHRHLPARSLMHQLPEAMGKLQQMLQHRWLKMPLEDRTPGLDHCFPSPLQGGREARGLIAPARFRCLHLSTWVQAMFSPCLLPACCYSYSQNNPCQAFAEGECSRFKTHINQLEPVWGIFSRKSLQPHFSPSFTTF
ncbi:uncharacterized protein LOC134512577 [Chroicocephalus ridibundus]|uniref:uncharacterized protein LOC134512577 n=1 Tax=Chroicocephalus ridibundus TaxID=1192867 RepID=UPI002FDCAAA9